MSISSDDPDFSAQLGRAYGSYPYGPGMGLAEGLLQGAGPSRMPVSLGQALAQGMQTAQQFSRQYSSSDMQRAHLALALARLQAMQGLGTTGDTTRLPGN